MNKTFKKIAASIMAISTLAVSMVGMSANAATNANIYNNYFNDFYVVPSIGGWSRLNQTDDKLDASWVYLYITSATRSVRVHTLGVTGNSTYNCTTNSIGAYCEKGKEYLISNSINESGYTKADLEFYSVSSYYSDYITGAWSPDSEVENGHTYTFV